MKRFIIRLLSVFVFVSVFSAFMGIAYYIHTLQNPEKRMITYLVKGKDERKHIISKALFSPDDHIKDTLIDLIHLERKSLKVAIYTLTDKDIARALLDASARGVDIEIVTDRAYASDRYSKLPMLANHKMPLWVYQIPHHGYSLMHNKFILFKDNILHESLVWTGSFNFTKSAHMSNQENVIILNNLDIYANFTKQFEKLKERSLLISGSRTTRVVDYAHTHKPQGFVNYILSFIGLDIS
jgi:phosphatidylserine/phosphatidylglycerophosphate/cardiolipin synthase-like enzyme